MLVLVIGSLDYLDKVKFGAKFLASVSLVVLICRQSVIDDLSISNCGAAL